jgi:SWI/SNF-related matrix-associated actin-dependent regulator of chromatin subfamily A3
MPARGRGKRSAGGTTRAPAAKKAKVTAPAETIDLTQSPTPAPSQPQLVDDEPEAIDLSQDRSRPEKELYGHIDIKIVGIRYYDGYAVDGEMVMPQREPSNPVSWLFSSCV